MTGRPSTFTPDLADRICAELADGRSLRSVCREDWAPSTQTVFRWLREHEGFRDQYARAKEEAADALADEITEIADDGRNDWMEKLDKDGTPVGWLLNGEAVSRSKLRVDSRKWLASKLKPKRYGDKLEVGGTGPGGAVLVQAVTGVPQAGEPEAEA